MPTTSPQVVAVDGTQHLRRYHDNTIPVALTDEDGAPLPLGGVTFRAGIDQPNEPENVATPTVTVTDEAGGLFALTLTVEQTEAVYEAVDRADEALLGVEVNLGAGVKFEVQATLGVVTPIPDGDPVDPAFALQVLTVAFRAEDGTVVSAQWDTVRDLTGVIEAAVLDSQLVPTFDGAALVLSRNDVEVTRSGDLTGPQGAQGETGPEGRGLASIDDTATGFEFTYTDATTQALDVPALTTAVTNAEADITEHADTEIARMSEALDLPPDFTVHLDPTSGNDAHDGTLPRLAKASASGTNGAASVLAPFDGGGVVTPSLGIRADSFLRDLVDVDGVEGIDVASYGGGLATVDGSDLVAPGDFALSAHADAGGVVYEFAWTRGASSAGAGQDHPMVWEGDAFLGTPGGDGSGLASQNRLVRRTSVALCAANPGSYYVPNSTAAASTVYVHPYGSTDPTTDGKAYYVTVRGAAIDGYASDVRVGTVEGVHARRAWGHYGALHWGASEPPDQWEIADAVRRCVAEGGGLHHMVTAARLAEDVVFLDVPRNYGQGIFPHTAYIADGTGETHTSRRQILIGDPAWTAENDGLYSHGSAAPFDAVTYEQCAAVDARKGMTAASPAVVTRGGYTRGVAQSGGLDNTASTVTHFLVNRPIAGVALPAFADIVPGSGERARVLEHGAAYVTMTNKNIVGVSGKAGTITLRNWVVVFETYGSLVNATQGTGVDLALTMEHCVIVMLNAGSGTKNTVATEGTYTGHHNVWVLDRNVIDFKFNGVTNRSLADHQAATGQDANSIALTPTTGGNTLADVFAGDPSAGDFRLRTDTGLTFGDGTPITDAGPQEHWDWNLRGVVAGAPQRWPVLPETVADARTYAEDPSAWNFYPS